jgi:hypothetical protein
LAIDMHPARWRMKLRSYRGPRYMRLAHFAILRLNCGT